MANWLVSREAIKRAGRQAGATAVADSRNAVIDSICESVSRQIERATHRNYIPVTATRYYRWPQYERTYSWSLWTGRDLLSVTQLISQASGTPDEITGFYLEPQHLGPPYSRVEVNLGGTEFFAAGDTPQRSIAVTGEWGFPAFPGTDEPSIEAAGTVTGLAASASATTMACSDASLIDVGDTLLIGSERIFVAERGASDTGATLAADLASSMATATATISDGSKVHAGEAILIDGERMFVRAVAGNVLSIERGWDATPIAAHTSGAKLYAFRSLTVERGVNGTVAAVHPDGTAISRYIVFGEARAMAIALALAELAQGDAAWGRSVGQGDGAMEFGGRALTSKFRDFTAKNRRLRAGTV